MYRRVRVFLGVVLLVGGMAACGNDNGDQPETANPAPSPGAGVPVRGTERLAWDQAAASYQQLFQYTFSVYVDGARSGLSGVECIDSQGASGFPCFARLPQMSNGTHVLEITATVGAVESARSLSLTVNVSQGRLVVGEMAIVDNTPRARPEGSPPSRSGRPGSLCVAQTACFTVTREITAAVPLSSPAATPDGRMFYIEDGRHVRIVDEGALSSEPAFSLTDGDSRLIALLVDPAFGRTRFVRLAWIEQTRRGRSLVIARLRESSNRLGEPAVIVPGILLAASGDPRLAQDDRGVIYVAIPGDGQTTRSGRDAYAASLLRFAADGLTWSEGFGAPILARGYEQPRALTFDPRTYRLWLTGGDHGRGEALTSIALGSRAEGSDQSGTAETQVAILPSSEAIIGLAPIGSNAARSARQSGPTSQRWLVASRSDATFRETGNEGASADFLALDAAGSLLIARAGPSGLAPQGRVSFESGEPLALDAGLHGGIFVTARSSAGFFSIFRLEQHIER